MSRSPSPRPHPGPLPQERENHSPVCGIAWGSFIRPVLISSGKKVATDRPPFQTIRDVRSLFPLLGGEGQREGEPIVSHVVDRVGLAAKASQKPFGPLDTCLPRSGPFRYCVS